MKKVILVVVMAMVGLASCKKEEIKPKVDSVKVENCNCGEVVDFGQTLTSESDGELMIQREVEVFNMCTGETSVEITDNPIVKRGDIICK